ncbi:MAG: dynein regulation protein LC7 [Chloroflexaceae bacterium]|nr:dynein regulation protein LC7 [Chloroflexaceae bacterium]NJL32995.1 dynein regulation protein LC7 [Chloroflexaceae bacterium]NJO06415.1 dynein regulation protein LC7 [Chloroflexaceae bacterium]NJO84082.1 dynein regulation protein LC7 [Blastochloris sp.]
MASRQEQIATILETLTSNAGGDIAGVAAVGMDGIVLVSRMSAEVNADRVGAVAATMMGVTRRVSNELRIGSAEETIIKSDAGLFMVLPASDQSLLAINLRQGANLGMVRLEAREAARAIGAVI